MSEFEEATALLNTFQKAHEHGPGMENIKELALVRLKELNHEAGKSLTKKKKAEADKLLADREAARQEAEKEVQAKIEAEDKLREESDAHLREGETRLRVEAETKVIAKAKQDEDAKNKALESSKVAALQNIDESPAPVIYNPSQTPHGEEIPEEEILTPDPVAPSPTTRRRV